MTGSMYEGLGYTPNGVQSAATKPVSGEAIVTFLERMDAIAEHGTKKGYDNGCRGSHCPGKDAVGMSCSQASIRYAGDMGYRRRVDAGVTAEQIWVEDQAAHVVMPKVNVRDPRGTRVFDGEQLTVEDSVAVYEADEDYAAEEAGESVPKQQAERVAVGGGERPAAAGRERACGRGRASRSSTSFQVVGQARLGRGVASGEAAWAIRVSAGGGGLRG